MRFSPLEQHRWGMAPPRPIGPGLDWKGRGPDVMLRALGQALATRGGALVLGARARNLLLEGGRCVGVEGTHGDEACTWHARRRRHRRRRLPGQPRTRAALDWPRPGAIAATRRRQQPRRWRADGARGRRRAAQPHQVLRPLADPLGAHRCARLALSGTRHGRRIRHRRRSRRPARRGRRTRRRVIEQCARAPARSGLRDPGLHRSHLGRAGQGRPLARQSAARALRRDADARAHARGPRGAGRHRQRRAGRDGRRRTTPRWQAAAWPTSRLRARPASSKPGPSLPRPTSRFHCAWASRTRPAA